MLTRHDKFPGPDCKILFDCDFLLSFPLVGWPSPAQEWVARERFWPDQEVVTRLASLPCHLIAKPSYEEDLTSWRFSFSRQEIELSQILPLNARLCYLGLKLIFKKEIKERCPSVLKSYHMLTLFLWFMESRPVHSWEEDSDQSCEFNLRALFSFVSLRLENSDIPHYFIRSLNLGKWTKPEKGKKTLQQVSVFIKQMMTNPSFPW